MSRRSSSLPGPGEWPLPVRLLILAAERECPAGHAGAFTALLSLAQTKVPARGIFDPAASSDEELFAAIDAVASRHLGLTAARAAWRRHLRHAALDLDARDKIEHAALRVQAVSDTAYFYAGLAFGIAAASLYRRGA